MSDLIDRQALLDSVYKNLPMIPSMSGMTAEEMRLRIAALIENAPTASPWHRVEEKPTQEGKYLVCDEMNNFYVVWWGPILGWCYDPKRFRYWMPIEPPKEDA